MADYNKPTRNVNDDFGDRVILSGEGQPSYVDLTPPGTEDISATPSDHTSSDLATPTSEPLNTPQQAGDSHSSHE